MRGLKIILRISSIGCLLGFVYATLRWKVMIHWMETTGVPPPGNEPATIYMFRLGFMAYGMMGVFLGILARDPLKYGAMLPLAAFFLICYGLFRLVGGIVYDYPILHYVGDVVVDNVFGSLILILRKRAMKSS